MARIYEGTPSKSDDDQSSFTLSIIRFEILAGSALTMLGGFMLRASDDYSLIVIGTTLVSLGVFRLWRRHEAENTTKTGFNQRDRLVGKLGRQLDANYTVVTDFEMDDNLTLPYLVLGPNGIVILDTLKFGGIVESTSYQDQWELISDSESEDGETKVRSIRNPTSINETRAMALKKQLRNAGLEAVPVTHRLVLLNHNVKGDPLNDESVVQLRNLDDQITSFGCPQLDWEEINDIERALALR